MSEAYFRVESGALGQEENFLSLDDILMSHEKLPVRTEIPIPRLGAFFPERSGGADTDNAIPQGSKLELPLWLAKGLFDNKRRILSVDLPKIYQEGWRTVFSADANVVDLHKMGPHFYGFGSQLLHFDSPENADISQSLLQTFIGRFRRIMDSSQNAYNEDTSALVASTSGPEKFLEYWEVLSDSLKFMQKFTQSCSESVLFCSIILRETPGELFIFMLGTIVFK
ncbi:DNA replication complex GINS protein PSF3 isoform X1 [Molossus molossus]|uniref:DNA replication complex GINS protein PSF3 isoform X1 n=1 Tax=Molossus molossus TaxID=27622 RepID=UPI0017464902|nr:DNA replication complex GINS protein PSF3 isoform X1 [Molossus molossus]